MCTLPRRKHSHGQETTIQGKRCLGSGELVYENRLKQLIMKRIWLERVKYNNPHKYALKLNGFPGYDVN